MSSTTALSTSLAIEGIFRRKVTASGVIWLGGRAYYVSRRLAGTTIPVTIGSGRLVVEASVPLRKEYRLPNIFRRPRGCRAARPAERLVDRED